MAGLWIFSMLQGYSSPLLLMNKHSQTLCQQSCFPSNLNIQTIINGLMPHLVLDSLRGMFLLSYFKLVSLIYLIKIHGISSFNLTKFELDDDKLALNAHIKRIINEYFVVSPVFLVKYIQN